MGGFVLELSFVADNVKTPGVRGYRQHMRDREGHESHTIEHETHLEYQTLIPDLVLESKYLASALRLSCPDARSCSAATRGAAQPSILIAPQGREAANMLVR